MNLESATFYQLGRSFGQSIKRREDPVAFAADWLWRTHTGQLKHENILVQACKVPVVAPIGVKRIDELLDRDFETGFSSGNVSSNVQSSQMLPAYSQVEVNGFTALDGKPIVPGQLQGKTFKAVNDSPWNSAEDKQTLAEVQRLLSPEAGQIPADEGTTLVRVMHVRDEETRYDQRSPVITHGWLLVGDRAQIHYAHQIRTGETSTKMMDRAKMVLSCERYETVDMLKIEDGQVTLVNAEVLAHLAADGKDISKIHITQPEDGAMAEPGPSPS